MKSSEIRKDARLALSGKWKKATSITLAYMIISFVLAFIQETVGENSIIYDIIDLAYLFINIPLSFGLLVCFIKLIRSEDVKSFDYFKEGFSRFKKAYGIFFHTFLRLLLPIILLIILIIVTAVQVVYSTLVLANSSAESTFFPIPVILLIATIIYCACKALLYVFAYNISYDNPELSSKECVLKSTELMKGNRGKYFLLQLSFIGWVLLLYFSFSLGTTLFVTLLGYWGFLLGYAIMIIGMLFLMSYMQVATICFYDKVTNNKKD